MTDKSDKGTFPMASVTRRISLCAMMAGAMLALPARASTPVEVSLVFYDFHGEGAQLLIDGVDSLRGSLTITGQSEALGLDLVQTISVKSCSEIEFISEDINEHLRVCAGDGTRTVYITPRHSPHLQVSNNVMVSLD